jgi:tetrahydrodipicolinate N-succinyltransferase
VLGSTFVYRRQQGHEIVFVYDAEFADKRKYQQNEIEGYEHRIDANFKAMWKSVDEIEKNGVRLVPEDLARLLTS